MKGQASALEGNPLFRTCITGRACCARLKGRNPFRARCSAIITRLPPCSLQFLLSSSLSQQPQLLQGARGSAPSQGARGR
jgi:hypothetical protein